MALARKNNMVASDDHIVLLIILDQLHGVCQSGKRIHRKASMNLKQRAKSVTNINTERAWFAPLVGTYAAEQ
ncbi:hypothetical protein [uncultured Zhongshania sp.]|mgnify:FL=1|uniref:hypothetical protein n=1 Tax=uncultured Zhongshania sp. TaxID=1642288 RepID=UPI0030DC02DE|tara:strand:- start:109 stop:324 length:216 start_codon:yes stop_codon:yes gene_type:complete